MSSERRKGTSQVRVCEVVDCLNTYYAKGLCHGHYMSKWRAKDRVRKGIVAKVPQRLTVCTFDGCDKPACTKNLCKGHYTQYRDGRELAPLRQYNGASFKDENGRVCNECKQYKTWEDFYENTNGTRRARCRKCISSTNNKRNKERTRTW